MKALSGLSDYHIKQRTGGSGVRPWGVSRSGDILAVAYTQGWDNVNLHGYLYIFFYNMETGEEIGWAKIDNHNRITGEKDALISVTINPSDNNDGTTSFEVSALYTSYAWDAEYFKTISYNPDGSIKK